LSASCPLQTHSNRIGSVIGESAIHATSRIRSLSQELSTDSNSTWSSSPAP